jgi:hypothetical protein
VRRRASHGPPPGPASPAGRVDAAGPRPRACQRPGDDQPRRTAGARVSFYSVVKEHCARIGFVSQEPRQRLRRDPQTDADGDGRPGEPGSAAHHIHLVDEVF